jgi:cephalosporin hydroxylase
MRATNVFSQTSWMTARLRLRQALMPLRSRMPAARKTVERFHQLYFDAHLSGGTWADTYWLGVPLAKCPLDLWIYQEIVSHTRPDLVIETGTFKGGSALFFASLFDLAGGGDVVRSIPKSTAIDPIIRGSRT